MTEFDDEHDHSADPKKGGSTSKTPSQSQSGPVAPLKDSYPDRETCEAAVKALAASERISLRIPASDRARGTAHLCCNCQGVNSKCAYSFKIARGDDDLWFVLFGTSRAVAEHWITGE